MKTNKLVRISIILCLVFLFGATSAFPTGLLAAPWGERGQTGAHIDAFPGRYDTDQASSDFEGDPQSERLTLISEISGYQAVEEPISEECFFDSGYGVYLCEPLSPAIALNPNPVARAQALRILNSNGLLLIPDSINKRIMTFDPTSGDLIDPNFIILEDEPTGTIIHAIMAADNNSFLISDQTRNVVHHYNMDGEYLGVFAPVGGADTDIMQNIRGISLRPNGNLLVSVGGGGNAHAIAEFDTTGEFLGNFIDNGSGGLESPFDVYASPETDWLVSSINTNQVLQYEWATGNPLGVFASISSFPQQIYEIANSNVLVSNFSGTPGVYEFTAAGGLVGIYNPDGISNYRGVFELSNGNILATTSGGVFEINRENELVETKITGSSRFVEFVQLPGIILNKTLGLDPDVCADSDEIVVPAGTLVTYCYEVTNTWDITLELHDLVDDQLGVLLDEFAYNLGPGASVFLLQTVEIWEDTTNTATWTAYNPGPSDVVESSDSATVNILFHAVELSPEELSSSGDPGETVEYSLTLTNTGNAADEFTVEAGESEWEVLLIETEFELQASESAQVFVHVDVPLDALAGDQDMVVITAISAGDGSETASSMLTTTANAVFDLMLAPGDAASFGDPGETVEYTLTLTNLGNGPDTIEVEVGFSEWLVNLPETVFSLGTGESSEVVVLVEIPPEVLADEQDSVTVTAVSAGDASITASSSLTTTANAVYDLVLEPPIAAQSGDPGEMVEYTLTLTNSGNTLDTFDLEVSESEWDVNLPDTSFDLEAGESVEIVIQISIPAESLAGDQVVVVITVSSVGEDSLSATSTLTTTANPVYDLALAPEEVWLTGEPGETVEYSLTQTNLSNTVETFTLQVAGNVWEVSLIETTYEIEVGASVEIIVAVTILAEATDGESDMVIISATSESDASISASSELTTTAEINWYWVYLPSLFKAGTP